MRPVVLFAAVMLVTAGCGDSETTTPTETAAASTVTTQAVATTIAPVTTTIAPTTTTASAARRT